MPERQFARRIRDKLRRHSCSWCGQRLDRVHAGDCAMLFGDPRDCAWRRAFAAFGVDEAMRLSRLPHGQRPALPELPPDA